MSPHARAADNKPLTIGQIEWIDRPPDFLEFQLPIVRSANADPGALDDGLRHWTEPGPPVDAALQHHIALLQRVDAEAREAIKVGGLDMARDQHDLGRAGVEHYCCTHIHHGAAPHRAAVLVAPI